MGLHPYTHTPPVSFFFFFSVIGYPLRVKDMKEMASWGAYTIVLAFSVSGFLLGPKYPRCRLRTRYLDNGKAHIHNSLTKNHALSHVFLNEKLALNNRNLSSLPEHANLNSNPYQPTKQPTCLLTQTNPNQ